MAFDPFEMQKKMMSEWEKNLGKYIEKTMRQPEFMKLVAANMSSTLDLQAAIKKQTQSLLKNLSLATEDDLARLFETMNAVESRVLDIEERLDSMDLAGDPAVSSSTRTDFAKPESKNQSAGKSTDKKSTDEKSTSSQKTGGTGSPDAASGGGRNDTSKSRQTSSRARDLKSKIMTVTSSRRTSPKSGKKG